MVGTPPEALVSLGGFESFVFKIPDRATIVKATWGERRTPGQIGAELHFVNHLADHGAPVCRALPLADGALLGTVAVEGGEFHVSAFAEAPGGVMPREEMTLAYFEQVGEAVGLLHRLSAAYRGPPQGMSRPDWRSEYAEMLAWSTDNPVIHAHFSALLDQIGGLPRPVGSFGAMHGDLHQRNIHWHDGGLSIFDFDDMLDFWFVSDLAIILYYALLQPIWDTRQADLLRIYPALMSGYARQHTLPDGCLEEALPLFLFLREHTLRAVVRRSVPPGKGVGIWKTFVADSTERILSGQPALGLQLP
ncbi:MAG: Ser/Thr protein kinase RdoA (MazF antagonist) [Myxococcota bacterium]